MVRQSLHDKLATTSNHCFRYYDKIITIYHHFQTGSSLEDVKVALREVASQYINVDQMDYGDSLTFEFEMDLPEVKHRFKQKFEHTNPLY